MPPTQSGSSVSQGLWRAHETEKRNKKIRFSALLHHVTTSLLRNCFYSLKRQAAPGVGGVTWQEYEQDLEARLTGSRVAFIEERIELNPRDESKSQRHRKGYFSLWRKATSTL
jgi:hypothetical protein